MYETFVHNKEHGVLPAQTQGKTVSTDEWKRTLTASVAKLLDNGRAV
jgi:hypothetical protein